MCCECVTAAAVCVNSLNTLKAPYIPVMSQLVTALRTRERADATTTGRRDRFSSSEEEPWTHAAPPSLQLLFLPFSSTASFICFTSSTFV